jgi:metal-dependent HD superfamily phosphatase/phosphodiesterase
MIKKSVFEDELVAGMQRELVAHEKSEAINNLDKAVEYLHSAVQVFEEAGMNAQADAILHVLLKVAKGHGKHDHGKKDPHTFGLDSEKMIKNLSRHGTEFNMVDDGGIDDLLDADMNGEDLDIFEADFEDMDFEEER